MRYLYIVIGLTLIILGIAGMTFLRFGPPESEEFIRVNKRIITIDEFEKAYSEAVTLYDQKKSKKDFIEDLITKELLLQEAKQRGLDLKPDFRRSIQNYYEQTLLRNLTEERMREIEVTVTEEEIASYYGEMGKVFIVRTLFFPDEASAMAALKNLPTDKGELKMLYFDDLPNEFINEILALKEGEILNRPIKTEKGFLILKIEAIRKKGVPALEKVREEIKKTIEEKKRRTEMEKWLDELRKRARIRIKEELLR